MRRPLAALAFSTVTPALLVLGSFSVASAQAAAPKLAGQWLVHYERPVTISHGEAAAPQDVRAKITLRQVGDSVFGAWQYVPAPGETPGIANEIRGALRHDTASVTVLPVVDPDAGMLASVGETIVEWIKKNVHGISPTVTMLDFSVRGDTLRGVRRIVAVDGSAKDRTFVLSGLRVKP